MNSVDYIPFQTINWETIAKTEHTGETGTSWWQTIQFPGLRIRIVEYSKGYLADHWCQKGHISANGVKLLIVDGDFLKLK
jgi:hypothetical protein